MQNFPKVSNTATFILLFQCVLANGTNITDGITHTKDRNQTRFIESPQITKEFSKAINLEQCMSLARQNYPITKQSTLLDEALNLTLDKLNMGFIPHLRFNSKISYQSDVTTLPFNMSMGNPLFQGFTYTPLTRDQYQFALEVSQPLLDMGSFAQKDISKAQYASQKQEVQNNLYKIQQSVINAYFTIILLDFSIAQNATYSRDLEKNYKNLNVLYVNGVIGKDALDKLSIEILNAQKNAKELESQRKIMQNTLGFLTQESLLDLRLEIPNFQEQQSFLESIATKAGEANSSLFALRPEMHFFSLKANELDTHKKLELAKGLPYIDAFLQGGYSNPGLNFLKGGFQPYYIVGLRINWDFSNFYTKYQQDSLIRNQKLRLDTQKEEFLLNTKILLNQHIKTAQNLLTQMSDNEKIIALQEQVVRTQESKLKNGVLSINDFISDTNNLYLKKLQQNYTKVEFLMQVYNIKQILNSWEHN